MNRPERAFRRHCKENKKTGKSLLGAITDRPSVSKKSFRHAEPSFLNLKTFKKLF